MYACHLCAMNVCFLQQKFKCIFCVWCSVECMHVIHVRREQCIVGRVCVKSNWVCGCDSCSLLVKYMVFVVRACVSGALCCVLFAVLWNVFMSLASRMNAVLNCVRCGGWDVPLACRCICVVLCVCSFYPGAWAFTVEKMCVIGGPKAECGVWTSVPVYLFRGCGVHMCMMLG